MSRKKTEINPIRAERLNTIIQREGLKQKQLAEKIFITQQSITRILHLEQSLTEGTAKAIINAFPKYRIEWLLGYDNIMLQTDEIKQMINNKVDTAEAINHVIRLIADDICKREKIKRPDIPFIPDFSFLQTQLHDYAELIMYDYLINRKHSRTWIRIDKKTSQEGNNNETGKR